MQKMINNEGNENEYDNQKEKKNENEYEKAFFIYFNNNFYVIFNRILTSFRSV